MKVWVLYYQEYDEFEVVGVYSKKKRAHQMIPFVTKFNRNRRKDYFSIEPYVVDESAVRIEVDRKPVLKLPRWVRR